MPLNDAQFKSDLKALYDATRVTGGDEATAYDNFLTAFVAAVKSYITSAEIVYINGLEAPGGPVTGDFNGELQ